VGARQEELGFSCFENNMSRLLIPSRPLQLIPELAVQIGLNEALVLQQLHYWLDESKHEHDGRRWIYNTLGEWQAQFPFWSEDTLQRIMKSLKTQGLVIIKQFNKSNWDRTNWYTIEYEAVENLVEKSVEISAQCEAKKLSIASNLSERRRKSTSS
jgi:hypothetical protein